VLGAAAAGGGVSHGALLIGFAEAVLGEEDARLSEARARLRKHMPEAALVDAAAVVGFFNAIDRVADATGIPLDAERVPQTADFRAALGLDTFAQDRL
jgi:alkylhydroperoxidase family enzyme